MSILLSMAVTTAWTVWVVCSYSYSKRIRRNVNSVQPHLAVENSRVGVDQLNLSSAKALHLAANQHNAGFEHVENLVIVSSLAITREHGVR